MCDVSKTILYIFFTFYSVYVWEQQHPLPISPLLIQLSVYSRSTPLSASQTSIPLRPSASNHIPSTPHSSSLSLLPAHQSYARDCNRKMSLYRPQNHALFVG